MAYKIPKFEIDEILEACSVMDIEVHLSDIKKPTYERWRKLYKDLLYVIAKIPRDQFDQPPLASRYVFEHAELHQDSAAQMTFVLVLRRIWQSFGIDDFSYSDLVEPTSSRIVRILSAAINFHSFAVEQRETINKIRAKYQEQGHLLNTNEELKQKINKVKAKRAEEEPAVNELKQKIADAKKQTSEYFKMQEAKQKEINEIKEKIIDGTAQKEELKMQMMNAQQESESLSQKIVQSPEKIKQEQQRMENNVALMRINLAEKREQAAALQTKVKDIQSVSVCYEKSIKTMQSIQEDHQKKNDVLKEIATLYEKNQEQQALLKNLDVQRSELEQKSLFVEEKMMQSSNQHRVKMGMVTGEITQAQKKLKVIKDLHQSDRMEREKIEKIIHQIQSENEMIDREIEEIQQTAEANFATMSQNLDKYHVQIITKTNEIFKAF